jgi:quercetin dioxygenase-like cupin family protein
MFTPPVASRRHVLAALSCLLLTATGLAAADTTPLIQNTRVTVWDVAAGATPPPARSAHDVVTILIRGTEADVRFDARNTTRPAVPAGVRAIVVELQDAPVPTLPNTSGQPLAFPRPGSIQVLDNARVTIWRYAWTPGQPTPMHFHDKDVVVTYLADGALTSTDAKGQSVVNPHHFAYTKFNARNRVHTETLTQGQARAVMVELK